MYTKEDVLQFVEEEDVKFIRLSFFTPRDGQKNISIMSDELARAFSRGVEFEGEDLFSLKKSTTLILHPESETLAVLPWRPVNGKVVRMVCNITDLDGKPFPMDTRSALKAEEKKMARELTFYCKEKFVLNKLSDVGDYTDVVFDFGGAMDLSPMDRGENIRREICLTLKDMGIEPTRSFHSNGPGSNEIDLVAKNPVNCGDDIELFKWIVNVKATSYGLYVPQIETEIRIFFGDECLIKTKEREMMGGNFHNRLVSAPFGGTYSLERRHPVDYYTKILKMISDLS